MNHLLPLLIGTGFFGLLFIFMPCFVRKGPNQGIIRCSMWLALFSMWIFWATVYISQMNPLVGPRHKNSTLIFMRYKAINTRTKSREKTSFVVRPAGEKPPCKPGGEVTNAPTTHPPTPATKPHKGPKGLREKPDHCREQPDNVFECCNIPWLPRKARAKCIPDPANVFKLNCGDARCAFQEAGWLERGEVDLPQLNAYYDELAGTNPDWSEAVRLIKAQCLQINPKFQSVYTNCQEYDIMFCVLIRMLKHGPLDNWSTAAACAPAKQYTASCPMCPEECTVRDLSEYPENVCRACITL